MENNEPADRGIIREIFQSPDGRLRSGWRILIQTILLLPFGIIILVIPALFGLYNPESLDVRNLLVATLLQALTVTAAVLVARRFLDRRSFTSLGFEPTRYRLMDIVVGFFIPALLFGLIYLLFVILGWTDFVGFAWQSSGLLPTASGVVVWLGLFVLVGYYEELLFRGYQLRNILEGTNLITAVLLSSLLFGLAHFGNPGAGLTSTIGILVAGVFLAYAWVRTHQLWLPIALHVGWNFFEGTIFGFPVSGLPGFRLLEHDVSGPALITGGAFGPEAGLILLPALALGAALIWYYTRERELPPLGSQIEPEGPDIVYFEDESN